MLGLRIATAAVATTATVIWISYAWWRAHEPHEPYDVADWIMLFLWGALSVVAWRIFFWL